jgi:hypothetical protein
VRRSRQTVTCRAVSSGCHRGLARTAMSKPRSSGSLTPAVCPPRRTRPLAHQGGAGTVFPEPVPPQEDACRMARARGSPARAPAARNASAVRRKSGERCRVRVAADAERSIDSRAVWLRRVMWPTGDRPAAPGWRRPVPLQFGDCCRMSRFRPSAPGRGTPTCQVIYLGDRNGSWLGHISSNQEAAAQCGVDKLKSSARGRARADVQGRCDGLAPKAVGTSPPVATRLFRGNGPVRLEGFPAQDAFLLLVKLPSGGLGLSMRWLPGHLGPAFPIWSSPTSAASKPRERGW